MAEGGETYCRRRRNSGKGKTEKEGGERERCLENFANLSQNL